MSDEAQERNDYSMFGNIRVSERAYYLVTELGGKLKTAEAERDEARQQLAAERAARIEAQKLLREVWRRLNLYARPALILGSVVEDALAALPPAEGT